jgi:integrase
MPWAEQLPSGNWRAGWRDDLGKPRGKGGFKHERAARAYAGEQESKARRGEATDPGRSPTWSEWCEQWLELRHVESSTNGDDAQRIETYLRPKWGNARIARITREHVQVWVNEMTKAGKTPALVRRVYYTFSASMKAAMLARRIPANPCSHVKLPTLPDGTERYFTRAEFDAAVAKILDRDHRDAATLLAGTGLRFAELAGLHWNRISFEQRWISVNEVYVADEGIIRPYPKSKKPRVVGPLPSWVMSMLEARREQFGTGHGCGMRHGASRTVCRSGLVITAKSGKPLDDKNMLRRHWKPAQERAGIEPIGTVHDLRHTYASWLVQAGIPLQEVQRLLGHASIVTTQRYSHLGDTQNAAVLRALEQQGGQLLQLVTDSAPHVLHATTSAEG